MYYFKRVLNYFHIKSSISCLVQGIAKKILEPIGDLFECLTWNFIHFWKVLLKIWYFLWKTCYIPDYLWKPMPLCIIHVWWWSFYTLQSLFQREFIYLSFCNNTRVRCGKKDDKYGCMRSLLNNKAINIHLPVIQSYQHYLLPI